MKTLVYGYGNPGRQDDGLGPALVEKIQAWIKENGIEGIETDSNYQLNIEDAHEISEKDIVIFADASIEDIDDFILTKVSPSDSQIEFTMHAVSCAFVLDLCQKIYNSYPETYLLHIKGHEWDFKEGFSKEAQENLEKAFCFLKDHILDPEALRTRANED